MRKSRFTDEQFIAILKEQGGGATDDGGLPPARDLAADLLFLEVEVWRAGGFGREAFEGARRGEPKAGEVAGRGGDGQRYLEGDVAKKLLTPGARKSAVSWAIEEKDYSQRRACRLVGVAPKVYRHRRRRPNDGAFRARLKVLAAERRRFGYRRCIYC